MENYSNAYTEVCEILNNTDKNIVEKIPKSFLDFLEENKNKDYIFKVDKEKDLVSQDICEKARDILAIIFSEYICDKKRILEFDREIEDEKRKKYNPDEIFKKPVQAETKVEEKSLIKVDEKISVFHKIWEFIKRIFK